MKGLILRFAFVWKVTLININYHWQLCNKWLRFEIRSASLRMLTMAAKWRHLLVKVCHCHGKGRSCGYRITWLTFNFLEFQMKQDKLTIITRLSVKLTWLRHEAPPSGGVRLLSNHLAKKIMRLIWRQNTHCCRAHMYLHLVSNKQHIQRSNAKCIYYLLWQS